MLTYTKSLQTLAVEQYLLQLTLVSLRKVSKLVRITGMLHWLLKIIIETNNLVHYLEFKDVYINDQCKAMNSQMAPVRLLKMVDSTKYS